MIKLDASLNNKQFAAFLATVHSCYPEFRHETGSIPTSRVQIAKNNFQIIIKPLGRFELPDGVEEAVRQILKNVLADKSLMSSDEFKWSDVSRAHDQQQRHATTQEHEAMLRIRAKRRRQSGAMVGL